MAKKKMSVEEILAAARKSDGGGGSASQKPADEAPEEKPVEETAASDDSAQGSKPAASKPAAKPPSGGSGGKLSVAEMLAAARAEKSGEKPAAKKEAPKKPAAEKPAAKKPAAAEKPAAPQPAGKASTASILQAARAADRRGPVSKAQAAQAGGTATATKPKPAAKEKPTVPPMPAKPAYAKKPAAPSKSKDGEVDQDRRGMLAAMAVLVGSFLAVGFTAMSATFTLWTLGLARFMFPNILTEPPSQFKVGFPSDFPPDVVETKFKAQFGVWVVNAAYLGQQQVFALSTVCTHLGCTPNWLAGERKFKCPCHGSGFYIDGINFEGPAPRPLERYAIRIADDGQLEVDKSKTFQEEKGQWADPSSFVPV